VRHRCECARRLSLISPTNISTQRSFFGIQNCWRARTDCSRPLRPLIPRLRSGPPSLRSGVPLSQSAEWSNRLFVCRRFELSANKYFDPTIVFRYTKLLARPDGFEPPTTWFEARRDRKFGNFDIWKSLIFNNHARGMSVANSPKSTTKHYRITQKSGNHLVILWLGGYGTCGTLRQAGRPPAFPRELVSLPLV